MGGDSLTKDEERIARTEALFRDVNERIAESVGRFQADEATFVCECADRDCTQRVHASLPEYEEVREDPTRFLIAEGHEDARVERVVEQRPGFAVVEKFNAAVARIVRHLDPRASEA
jgi:predicted ATPase